MAEQYSRIMPRGRLSRVPVLSVFFFSSRRRHTRYIGDWSFRRVLFRSQAAAVSLVANTAPVAFGAIAIPIVTLAEVSGLDKGDLGSMVGRQTPFLALIVPLILIAMVDGRRGLRQAWPAAIVGGGAFAVMQF